jgi:S-adenosylmethionine:tRNA ribosyltransferase-isomerase
MIAARHPVQRPPDARLLHVDARGELHHAPRRRFAQLMRPGDLLVANDAATLPASLSGIHVRSGAPIEVRLAQRRALGSGWSGVKAFVFGAGDWRTRTEDRPAPPALRAGDALVLGTLPATVVEILGHPRFVALRLHASDAQVWSVLARQGRPVQYAHLASDLQMWDVWTPIAADAVSFEPPSAGFLLDWRSLEALRERGVGFATITHAAGLSSTGEAALDALLPLDEPYRIPRATARAIAATRASGGRIVALGTTVVRALEHAAARDGIVRAGGGLATQRLGPASRLRVVDAVISGTHEPGTSHYELLRAFTDDATLERASAELERERYRTHEYGDSVLVERVSAGLLRAPLRPARCPGTSAGSSGPPPGSSPRAHGSGRAGTASGPDPGCAVPPSSGTRRSRACPPAP